MSGKLNVFVSYSHKDAAWLGRVQVHLRPLAREGKLELWDDTRIKTGEQWHDEIAAALAKADVAVLLISADFYASDFIANHELPPLLKAAQDDHGLVIAGVHISYSRFDRDHVLAAYQTVNTPDQPIKDLPEAQQDKVFDALARRIEELLEGPAYPAAPGHSRRFGRLWGEIPKLPPRYVERANDLDGIKAKLQDGATDGPVSGARGAAILGMGGIGKTTLAAGVVEDPAVRAAFPDGIAWLTLGQTPDILSLQRRLLAWVVPGVDPPTEVQEGRDALDAALKSRRWLIVLDDVWRQADLHAFEVADTPTRLLITTRDEAIVRASGTAPHAVEALSEAAARSFLAAAVSLEERDLPPEAAEVIRECGRLPMALALAGATLADAPKYQALWRDVIDALAGADHDQLSHEFDYTYAHPLAAIQASVDFLPEDDRAAYLQLAIFPEDTPIPLAPLEKLWGITGLKLRNRAKLLVDRALARRHEDGAIALHDLQGDFVRKRCPDVAAVHDALLIGYRQGETTPWPELADDYLVEWLPYHLMGAGRGDAFRDLLFEFAWLRRKLAERDVNALIADAALWPDGEVGRLGRALRMSAHVLDREKRQLVPQLLGRFAREDGPRVARLLDVASGEIPADVMAPRGYRHLLAPGALLRTLQGYGRSLTSGVLLLDDARALSCSRDGTLQLWNLESGTSRAFEGHGNAIKCAMVLPDGTRALSWSQDGTLRLWDLENGASQALGGHTSWVNGAHLLADGAHVLSWSADHTLRLWDLESGTSRVLEGHSDSVLGAEVVADGARALSWSADHTLRLWDLESGTSRVLEGHSDRVFGAVVLAGGARALSRSDDHTLRLWDLASGTSRVLKGHSGSVDGVVVSADGMRALSWSDDNTLRLWDLASGVNQVLEERADAFYDAVALADGVRALSWSNDDAIRLWDLQSGALLQTLEGHVGLVVGAVMLADGAHVLSWARDGSLRLWDLANATSRALEGHSGPVDGVAVLAEGTRALSWSHYDQTLRLWDLEVDPGRAGDRHGDRVVGALVAADGKRVLSWSDDHTLRLWDLESGASRTLEGHSGGVCGAAVLDDGARALSWSGDHTLCLWDLKTGASRALEGHSGEVSGAAVLGDGMRALSWSRDHTLRLWDLETGASRSLKGHRRRVAGAAVLPDGARALSWSDDNTLRLWDLASGTSGVLEGHTDWVAGAAIMANGAHALSWSGDHTLRLWDLAGGASRAFDGHSSWINGAVVLEGGARALSWSHDGTLRLWDLQDGTSEKLDGDGEELDEDSAVEGAVVSADGARALSWVFTWDSSDHALRLWELIGATLIRKLEGHRAPVEGAVMLADGLHALSWSADQTLRLWDLVTCQELARFVGDDPLTCCTLTAHGRLAVVGDSRGRVLCFDLPSLTPAPIASPAQPVRPLGARARRAQIPTVSWTHRNRTTLW